MAHEALVEPAAQESAEAEAETDTDARTWPRLAMGDEQKEPPRTRARTAAAGKGMQAAAAGRKEERDAAEAPAAESSAEEGFVAPVRRAARAASSAGAAGQAAAAVAAPPFQPTSAAARCDPDSLSIVLSYLCMPDFLAAIRVNKQWRQARLKHTAWPKFNLATFIQSLRDDNYDDPASRRLVLSLSSANLEQELVRLSSIAAEQKSAAAGQSPHAADDGNPASAETMTPAAAVASPAVVSVPPSLWRNATDALLAVGSGVQPAVADEALMRMAQLPHLSALNLCRMRGMEEGVQVAFSAMTNRLKALLLFLCAPSVSAHLPMLSQLRVLVLDRPPTAESLLPLHRLEYLHVAIHHDASGNVLPTPLAHALRWLSVNHALRALSLTKLAGTGVDPLLRPPLDSDMHASDELAFVELPEGLTGAQGAAREKSATAHLPPVDWSMPCGLSEVSVEHPMHSTTFALVCQLPNLTRLQAFGGLYDRHEDEPAMFPLPLHTLSLPGLQQLRLKFPRTDVPFCEPQLGLQHVARVHHLRVLQLSVQGRMSVNVPELMDALSSSAPTLEEVRAHHSILLGKPEAQGAGGTGGTNASTAAVSSSRLAAAPASAWGPLAHCTRLRVLQLAVHRTELPSLLEVLGTLPAFRSLELQVHPDRSSLGLLPSIMPHMARSRSWGFLHLQVSYTSLTGAGSLLNRLMSPAAMGVDHAATMQRVRVHLHEQHTEHVFVIRASADGQLQWQRE